LINLHIDIVNRRAITSGWNGSSPFPNLPFKAGDTIPINVFFYIPRLDIEAPFDLQNLSAGDVVLKLFDGANNVLSTLYPLSVITPATSAPTITRITSGTAVLGEYDRIQFASPPFAGSYSIVFKSGSASQNIATSSTVRVYPTITPEDVIIGALSYMQATPYQVAIIAPTILDLSGSASNTNPPRITEVNVTDLDYGFGWSGNLDLTPTAVIAAKGNAGISLSVYISEPGAGGFQSVLQLPIILS
jgi:hypothetical protein